MSKEVVGGGMVGLVGFLNADAATPLADEVFEACLRALIDPNAVRNSFDEALRLVKIKLAEGRYPPGCMAAVVDSLRQQGYLGAGWFTLGSGIETVTYVTIPVPN